MTNPFWVPRPMWRGEPCYVVGGGSSLEGFDWEVLNGLNVIGCNAAFYQGPATIPITLFGDANFLFQHRAGLENYVKGGGTVFTNSRRCKNIPSWLVVTRKHIKGLSIDGLAWNGNTGASAINLALLFGANPIYLLGFDMCLSKDGTRANFHNAYSHLPNKKAYTRFKRGMNWLKRDMNKLFPDVQVINLEDGTSTMTTFEKSSLKAHFAERRNG